MNAALPRVTTNMVLASFAAGALLHVDRAPLWCVVVALLSIAWHWLHSRERLRLPNTVLRLAIALGLFLGIAASFRTVSGLAAGSALLLVMGAAKLLETRTRRDVAVVATVSLVLVLAACLDWQSLLRVPLYLAAAWTALSSIAAMGGARESASAARAYGTAGRALLLALPLAALCFVLVPRMQGALWAMPGSEQGQTGLADEMSPGSISELALSEEIAFRVRFQGSAPPMAQRYWRGPVLHDFDGYTWRRMPGQIAVTQESTPLSPALRYTVMLEATGRSHLFGLDSIASISGRRNFRSFDGQVMAASPITAPVSYEGVSHVQTRYNGTLSINGRRLDTRLPPGRNLRSIALAREMRGRATSDQHYTQLVLDYFRAQGFEYTLTPPLLDLDSVDDLIFNTRLGFCGHFASAYVTLMRAAGIPARVVTGYLGGAWNPVGGYYAVRQSQAHAWAEVWLDGEGWTRIDPTAVVAPERLQQGSDGLGDGSAGRSSLFGDAAWLRNLRDSWDAASNWWQERIVNFNRRAQLDLLQRLGLGNIDYFGMAALLGSGLALWGLLLWLANARRSTALPHDAIGKIWNRFIALLGRRGLVIAIHEGPRSVAARAAQHLPAAATEIGRFASQYEQLRFGSAAPSDAAISALRDQLRRIARATAASRHSRTAAVTRE